MNGWKEHKWGEIATLEYGKGLANYQNDNGKYPALGTNGKIGTSDIFLNSNPGIIIGRKGAYRGVHYSTTPFYVIDTAFYLKPKINDLDIKYAYYQLLTKDINSMDSGSAIPSTSREDFYDLNIYLPPFKEQKLIAETLTGLDDKIDLLQRQNKTLEQLAETLFRQWFAEEASEDWEEGKVIDLFVLQRGFDLPSQNRVEGKYPVITASGANGFHNEYKVKAPGVTTGRSGLLGEVFYIDTDFWALNTSLFIVEYKLATPLFAYFFLKSLDLASLNGGSAVPTLNRNDVHDLETQLPPKELMQNFENIAFTFFEKIKSNNTQIKTLTQLRDSLLPKLMSGEVRVKN